jgi:D-sedoheptulose 7-phosphate isomerase
MVDVQRFPQKFIESAAEYAESYWATCYAAAHLIESRMVALGADLISKTISRRGTIYACGNGGSGAIANHLLCDFVKGMQTDTAVQAKVISLSSHTELLLAIGNDIDFSEIFRYQVKTWAKPGDLLLAISSSGNSENIIHAVQWAKENGVATLALTGFDGGRARALADVCIHVPVRNYGIVEDLHQSIMHIFAQFLRQQRMNPDLISTRNF